MTAEREGKKRKAGNDNNNQAKKVGAPSKAGTIQANHAKPKAKSGPAKQGGGQKRQAKTTTQSRGPDYTDPLALKQGIETANGFIVADVKICFFLNLSITVVQTS